MMPYIVHKPEQVRNSEELVREIVKELRGENGDADLSPAPQSPVIDEEETPIGLLHVTIIWDKWASLETRERGKVIVDAYRQFSEDKMRRISIALGLTRAEANRLGFAG